VIKILAIIALLGEMIWVAAGLPALIGVPRGSTTTIAGFETK